MTNTKEEFVIDTNLDDIDFIQEQFESYPDDICYPYRIPLRHQLIRESEQWLNRHDNN